VIPRAYITEWRAQAPWPADSQVEQDLVISRALVEMYARPRIAETLAFRGGTALHKLHFRPPGRYSEDIDLVQIDAGPIGSVLDEVRTALDPWLGEPSRAQSADGVKLTYRFETTTLPTQRMRVKVEINTREHFTCRGLRTHQYAVVSRWLEATAPITTYDVEELLGTKMRALYQRKKGRDLYDLWAALAVLDADAEGIVECFRSYIRSDGGAVTRAMYEENLGGKLASAAFRDDVLPLLRDGDGYSVDEAGALVHDRLVCRLPGAPWKGTT